MHLHDAAAGFIQRRMTKAAPHHVLELDAEIMYNGRDLGPMGVLEDFRSTATLSSNSLGIGVPGLLSTKATPLCGSRSSSVIQLALVFPSSRLGR